jgi:iron complex transport system substrate-binding protein
MKKFLSLMTALAMVFGMAACGSHAPETDVSSETKPETVTIQALNANRETVDVEVPYDPQRIAILDMPALDIVDALGVGDRVVGSAKVTIDYLTDYNPHSSGGAIMNLGTVKTADLEKVAACEPDIIFIGGRLSAMYTELEAIAPVVYLAVDYEKGILESTRYNTRTIASIFGKEAQVDAMFADFQPRIEALNNLLSGKNVLLGMYNANALSLMGSASQLNLIVRELGAKNLSDSVGETEKATHGEEASWETVLALNPEYMFILDRSTATGSADEGILGVREVIENDLIRELDVYKNGKIVYFIDHANVWYTSTGGVQALNTMLTDLEDALLN